MRIRVYKITTATGHVEMFRGTAAKAQKRVQAMNRTGAHVEMKRASRQDIREMGAA